MRSFITFGVFTLGLLTLFACRKEAGVIETIFGVTKIDRSISTDYDIVEFSVVTEDICFAIGQDNDFFKIFKTTDGGITWNELNNPSLSSQWDLEIQSIVFFDENNGVVVLKNKAYRTYDGGQSWTIVGTSDYTGNNYVNEFMFAGKNESNELVLAESNGNSWYDNHIFTSSASGTSYNLITHFDHNGDDYDYGSYSNGKLHYITRNFNFWEGRIYVYDFNLGTMETLHVNGAKPMDVKFANGRTVLARESGKINFHNGTSQEWNVDAYNFHSEDYFSIELIDDFYIAVANKSITTNYSGIWEEALTNKGTGHTENFMKVQKIDTKSVYISGEDGLFIKATFK
ncbi:MAG: hypothetical protein HRT58_20735 [Crocinitomicaceae bacterium]|nr:hypothetical protein [Flavobacteriales bacterium]NQZ38099.1 hypothetical protein [Crocinitomicaceae bacterium]